MTKPQTIAFDIVVETLDSDGEKHICGETGGHQSGGCGCEVEADETIMVGNTSFCIPCGEKIIDDEDA